MTLFQVLILGLIQGLTEFLPVSSSGHLVIAQNLFKLNHSPVFFDILVHVATALAIIIVLRQEIFKLNLKLIKYLLVASIPAGVIGFLLNSKIENLFSSLPLVGLSLLVTAGLLFSTKLFVSKASSNLTLKNTFFIGLLQALAIIPGISRSGSTITAGLFGKLKPITAFNFSFLLSLPAIFGAQLLQLNKLELVNSSQIPIYAVGFLSAFISGYFALKLLRNLVIKGNLYKFGYYCLFLGLTVLFIL